MEERSNIIGSTVLSVESDIKNIEEIESVLKKYCVTYSSISRTLFNTIVNASEPQKLCNGLQREYIKKYDIQARVFKSVWKHVCGKIQSIKSNQKNYDVLREKKIEKLEKKLADYIANNINKQKKKSVKQIEFEDPFNPENIDMFKDVVFDTNNTNDTKNIKNKKCKKTKKANKNKKSDSKSHIFNMRRKIHRLKQKNDLKQEINSTWGSKFLFKKQWNCEDHGRWLEKWKIQRDNNFVLIGSKDESFGNSLCQLRSLKEIRLTLPKNFSQKHLVIKVDFDKDKKLYQYLKSAIALGKALTFRVFQNPENRKWYVQIMFQLTNDCVDYANGTIGVDINCDLITTTIIKQDGNAELFTNYRYGLNDDNKDINKQILSDIVNSIVEQAIKHRKSVTIEEISLKNVLKNKKISAVCYNLFISLLRSRCVKKGICLYEVNPAYTSVISRLKYAKRYGRSVHATAAMVIGRRGLGFVEKIPSVYIGLLQGEERNQSLLMQWNLINKRLLKVKKSESGLKNLVSDQSSCSPTPSVSQRWVEQ